MISVTLQYVLDGNIPDDRQTGVYVWIDTNGEVLYVGKSLNIHNRFLAHFGLDHWRKESEIGRHAARNMPDALSWTILLYNLEDCRELYPPDLLAMARSNPPADSFVIDMAERTLIANLEPRLNAVRVNYTTSRYTHAKPNESSALHLAV